MPRAGFEFREGLGRPLTCRKGESGLVLWLPLREPSGTRANDLSPKGNHGTVTGATVVAGRVGSARSFDGSAQYISVADDPSLDLTQFTIEVSFKLSSLYAYNGLYRKQGGGGDENYSVYIKASGGVHEPIHFTDCDRRTDCDLSDGTLAAAIWYLLAQSYTSGHWSAHLDGSLLLAITTVTKTPNVNSQPLYISINEASRYLKGIIEYVRIYNRHLTDGELLSHARKPYYALGLVHGG